MSGEVKTKPNTSNETPQKKLNIVIVGGGIMGSDIAVIFLACGWNVHIMSPSLNTRNTLPARINAAIKKVHISSNELGKLTTYSKFKDIDWENTDLFYSSKSGHGISGGLVFCASGSLSFLPLEKALARGFVAAFGFAFRSRARHCFLSWFTLELAARACGRSFDVVLVTLPKWCH
jgi:hypothetical protein